MIFMLSGFLAVAFCLCMYTSGLLCCGILFVYVYIMAFLLWHFVCVCTHHFFLLCKILRVRERKSCRVGAGDNYF